MDIYQGGRNTLNIDVQGEGPIVEAIRGVLNFKHDTTLGMKWDNEHCFVVTPHSPFYSLAYIAPILIFLPILMVGFSLALADELAATLYLRSLGFRQFPRR